MRLMSSWLWYLVAGTMLAILGCGFQPPCPQSGDTISMVLTFDDGPLSADVPPDKKAAAGQTQLDPLRQILDTLDRRGIRAVFYISGPGMSPDPDTLKPIFGEGLAAIHEAGHVLGYHGFQHDPAIWAAPLEPPFLALQAIRNDLDQLEQFIDDALGPIGLARLDVFTSVFRQPYGGAAITSHEGRRVVYERGWVYHGAMTDSLDWVGHADVPPDMRDRILASADNDPVELVTGQLMSAPQTAGCRPTVDVLFHVNGLTADHLDQWIDTLATAFSEQGHPVVFDVPDSYLSETDPFFDTSVFGLLLKNNPRPMHHGPIGEDKPPIPPF